MKQQRETKPTDSKNCICNVTKTFATNSHAKWSKARKNLRTRQYFAVFVLPMGELPRSILHTTLSTL